MNIFADISRKRTEPERTFTDITRNNLEYFSIHYYLCRAEGSMVMPYWLYIHIYLYNLEVYPIENIWWQ